MLRSVSIKANTLPSKMVTVPQKERTRGMAVSSSKRASAPLAAPTSPALPSAAPAASVPPRSARL